MNDTDIFPIVPMPYHVRVTNEGLETSSPGRVALERFIMEVYVPDVHLVSAESTNRVISRYDQLSVTVDWTQKGGSSSMRAPIVRGSPYITMEYKGLTPVFNTIHAILSINGDGSQNRRVTGTQFVIQFNNGQLWKLYSLSNSPITLQWVNVNKMAAMTPFVGTLRLAIVHDANDLSALDAGAETYPVGGDVSYSFSTCSDSSVRANIQFTWVTKGADPSALLMLALPHHVDSLVAPNTTLTKRYRSMKGRMTGVIGNIWNLEEKLASISWTAPRPINPSMRADVAAALNQDKFKRAGSYATYWNGKELAAMGRLALIADELGQTDTASFIRERLKVDMDNWLLATNWNKLVYDRTWGGICSQSSMQNVYADFGLGWYNDHHFHYGYFAYAAAALGKADNAWLMSRKQQIVDLIRDFANPSKLDSFFPVTRNKDWYDGHSWAAGIFNFGDSKNQESSSEAVNAYYGVYLLGEALGDQQMSLFGRLLLATEIRSVQKYWQIKSSSEIYESEFAAHKLVGVLWSGKVDYTTFFGGLPEYVHGIQKLPFTPITEQLLDPAWIAEEHVVASQILTRSTPPVSDDWKAFTVMSGAILDQQSAWTQAHSLRYYDNGNTKTNTLYFIATR